MSTRDRLMKEPSMPNQHKTGPESCQGGCRVGSRASRSAAPYTPRAVTAALVRYRAICPESRRGAAFRRYMMLTLLLLVAYRLNTPQAFAVTSNEVSDSLLTADHVHVTAHRAGDTLLITLRIDPGYHVNANPASSENLIPTSIAFEGVAPERIAYPPAIRFKTRFADDVLDVYEGSVVITARFPSGALDRTHDLGFTVTAQACTEEICLPPDDIPGRATW